MMNNLGLNIQDPFATIKKVEYFEYLHNLNCYTVCTGYFLK